LTADQEERSRRIWQAIMSLSTEDREIILLREFHGLSYQAIADAMGCPIGTVMSRLHVARKRLRMVLEKRGISL
jgi:RNA polymerase sigma-70 factor (ECF subfamily)